MEKGKFLKIRCKGKKLTHTTVPHARHASKSEKGTTISAKELSLRLPTINLEKGGKGKSLCQFLKRRMKSQVRE
jgi:hypothetical protein